MRRRIRKADVSLESGRVEIEDVDTYGGLFTLEAGRDYG